jgi:hypothetical protein
MMLRFCALVMLLLASASAPGSCLAMLRRLQCSGAGPWLAAGARLSLRTSWDPPPEQDCQNFCV